MKKILIIVGCFVLFFCVAVGKSILSFKAEEDLASSFKPYISFLMDAEFASQEDKEPYIRGKVVTLDVEQRAVDFWTYPKLKESLKALSLSEVGTVVLISWDWQKEGHYENVETGEKTGDALRGMAKVVIADFKLKRIIEEKVFYGQAPLKGTTQEGDFASQRPMFQIVKYLESLPRQ